MFARLMGGLATSIQHSSQLQRLERRTNAYSHGRNTESFVMCTVGLFKIADPYTWYSVLFMKAILSGPSMQSRTLPCVRW